MRTTAVVFEKPCEAAFREFDMPAPGPQEVTIRTNYSTISAGTEGWAFANQFTWQPTPYPCVPGYQRTGVVVAVGAEVKSWRVGERVFATTGSWKAEVNSSWGSHVAIGNTHQNELYRIPEGVDEIDASAMVVAQVGYNAAFRPVLERGQWVAVYGDGIIGQCAAQAARARGARVLLVGHRMERLKLALEFSANATINNRIESVAGRAKSICGNEPVAVVIDTVQSEAAQNEYQGLLQPRTGQIVYSGFTPGKVWADMGRLQQWELTTHFIAGWTRERMEATLELMRTKQMRIRPLVTHLVDASRGAEMFRMIRDKSEPFMGITLDWKGHSS